MIIALDIGNSNIKIGIGDDQRWRQHHRFPTHPAHDTGFYRSMIEQMMRKTQLAPAAIHAAVIGSVVPAVTKPFVDAIHQLFQIKPIQVDGSLPTGISLQVKEPDRVGADLIAGAAGAHNLVEGSCIFVDCGTATTVMMVEETGTLQGGAICAGLKASLRTLVEDTAQLPEIPLEIPSSSIGKTTIECMQAGLVTGHLCMIEGLIERMKAEMGPAEVVATGGLISILQAEATCFDHVEPTLVLDGLRLIAKRLF